MKFFIMHFLLLIIFQIIFLPKFSFGQGCPDPTQLGPRTADDKSMCAIVYKDAKNHMEDSCLGDSREVYNGERTGNLGDFNDVISSLAVREGCQLTVYWRDDFGGEHTQYTNNYANLDHDHIGIGDWDNDISSYECNCKFAPVDCSASDEWHLVQECKNDLPNTTMTCKYKESHGFSVGQSITNGESLTHSESLLIGLEFFAKFDVSGELTTEYDWSTSTEFSETMTIEIEADFQVNGGQHAGMYQIHGNCDDNLIRTQSYEVRDMGTQEVIKRIVRNKN
ncbi:unnamed protein product [Meganyctiphanes norvegica]|uniref:Uncharacterized protein n=1 Tax=Meganyctiphanes norvegica TaxID=48144 RepID=A0AAV2QVP0_MEGNR